ncbi:Protein of unknown function [Bacillus cereus]|uniref:Uncharacterized protein n=1 Tax=Bacillus wiedmannii TaxID=1890302 RepID=A0AB37Z294_9BACI|nr:Protein of unknown function [Bacillus wiedmannii]SCC69718.1 Protein of unknown function [Bacillus cereus]SCN41756.1 Protein of unknown function [Bacillus wiedmannii]
MHDSLLNTF